MSYVYPRNYGPICSIHQSIIEQIRRETRERETKREAKREMPLKKHIGRCKWSSIELILCSALEALWLVWARHLKHLFSLFLLYPTQSLNPMQICPLFSVVFILHCCWSSLFVEKLNGPPLFLPFSFLVFLSLRRVRYPMFKAKKIVPNSA